MFWFDGAEDTISVRHSDIPERPPTRTQVVRLPRSDHSIHQGLSDLDSLVVSQSTLPTCHTQAVRIARDACTDSSG